MLDRTCGAWIRPGYEWWDQNHDYVFSISDLGGLFGFVFFMPGNAYLRICLDSFPAVARFLEISCASLDGFWAGAVSLACWAVIGAGLNRIDEK
jgi:hypothetical protein